MLFYPAPRTGIIGLLILSIAAVGLFWPLAKLIAGLLTVLLAFTLLVDLLLTTSALRGKLELTREFARIVTVALPRPGKHVLANNSRLLIRCRIYEDHYPHIDKKLQEQWEHIPPRSSREWPLKFIIHQRGEVALGGAGLRVIAGLGLWVLQYRFDWQAKARVYPLIEELTRGDLFAHRRRLWGIGQHQSRKFGRGTEFDQLKDYTPDDEYRNINWKATARRGLPVVNQYHVEQSRDLMLLIDCGRLMHTEIGGRPRLDRYLDAAAHLAYICLSQKDRVGLIAFDNELRKVVAPSRRARQLDDLIDAMFDLKPRFVESDYARAVTTLKQRNPKRGLVVLFTDLVDSVSSQRAVMHLSRLARTHLPVVVILDDPAIPALATTVPVNREDAYVRGAAEQFISEKRRTLRTLSTRGCIIVNVTAETLNTALVNEYLEVKARNLL